MKAMGDGNSVRKLTLRIAQAAVPAAGAKYRYLVTEE